MTTPQGKRVMRALKARYGPSFSISSSARDLGTSKGYLSLVLQGHRPPSRRLLLALGVIKPERRSGIRVRMSYAEAEQVARGVVPVALRARVAGAVAVKECD